MNSFLIHSPLDDLLELRFFIHLFICNGLSFRIDTKSDENLQLNWTVRFQTINGLKDQRFNIMVWRVVRKLEKILNGLSAQIIESNNVAVNNTFLIEGVEYIFSVYGFTENGDVSDSDTFAIKYKNSKEDPTLILKDTESEEQFSVVMFGSDVVYADVPLVLEANVASCKITNDYYFEWKVTDTKSKVAVNVGTQRGKKLTVPNGKLIGGRAYDITCKIYHIANKKFITMSGVFVKVLKKGLSVNLNCEEVTVAKNVPFLLTATLINSDNVREPTSYKWMCKKNPDSIECENFASSNTSELNLVKGFETEGTYDVEVFVKKGEYNAKNKCQIIVRDGMLPVIDIEQKQKVVATNMPIEVQSQVSELIPGCNLRWTTVDEEGFGHLDNDFLPDIFQKRLAINSLEETFLSEMVEFGNNSFSRNYPLTIPAAYGNWPGLEPETLYKFRLTVECVCTMSVQCENKNGISSFSDITIRTNGPPSISPLTVKPSMGNSLVTVFTFSTKQATDIADDYPLWYMFGIRLAGQDITYINYFADHYFVDTILPYSDSPIVPILTVCDSRGACDTVEGDSILVDTPNTLTSAQIDYFKDRFQANIYRKEYKDAFYLATAALLTLEAMNNEEVYMDFLQLVETTTKSDINRLLAQKEKIDTITANSLVQEATPFVQKIHNTSDEFLLDILKIRDLLFEIVSQSPTNQGTINTQLPRKKRSPSSEPHKIHKREVSLEDVKNFLKISELIVNTTKDETKLANEKHKMLLNVIKSTPDLCRKTTKYATFLDSQFIHIGFEKINFRSNMPVISVPYTPQLDSKLGLSMIANMQFVSNEKFISKTAYCLAKYLLSAEIMTDDVDENQKGLVYYSSLYNDEATGQYRQISDDVAVLLKIPIQSDLLKEDKFHECRRWQNSIWTQGTCETNDKYDNINGRFYVLCKCDKLGYISLYVAENKPLPTEEIIYPEIVTTDVYEYGAMTDDILVMTTTEVPSQNKTSNVGNVICEENECQKPATGENTIIISSLVILLCGIIMTFVVLKICRRKLKIKSYNQVPPLAKNTIENGPKYRRFYADHLMEGSTESLIKYNILQDVLS